MHSICISDSRGYSSTIFLRNDFDENQFNARLLHNLCVMKENIYMYIVRIRNFLFCILYMCSVIRQQSVSECVSVYVCACESREV